MNFVSNFKCYYFLSLDHIDNTLLFATICFLISWNIYWIGQKVTRKVTFDTNSPWVSLKPEDSRVGPKIYNPEKFTIRITCTQIARQLKWIGPNPSGLAQLTSLLLGTILRFFRKKNKAILKFANTDIIFPKQIKPKRNITTQAKAVEMHTATQSVSCKIKTSSFSVCWNLTQLRRYLNPFGW